jgi:hypothetical protein
MRGKTLATYTGRAVGAAILALVLSAGTSWGYFFDEKREMSLSGLAYTRGTWALSEDDIGGYKGLWQKGNLVQHRNFLTLEWRHNLNRLSREFPTIGAVGRFLNLDALDYYLNMRFEYDGVWEWGGNTPAKIRQGGHNHNAKYFGKVNEPFSGAFTFYDALEFESSRRRIKEALYQWRLFEWYFNLTKGPLFVRIGRQNLSWGEADVFRLLDQINPLDNNFGGFTTALDERRIPLDMIRAQWSFGTVGPIGDLTLEGFFSNDQETAARTTLQGCFFCVATQIAPIMINRTPCGDPFFRSKDFRTAANPTGVPCSTRAAGPHASIEDGRGGARILGTIHDFTFSIAHYYTWSDTLYVQGKQISPTPEHAIWDISGPVFTQVTGKPATPENNPWGPGDPVNGGQPGGLVNAARAGVFGVPAATERNQRSSANSKRVQITGASLSFPVNALTGMFVGSDNPLYYIYTTLRAEVGFFQNEPRHHVFHDLSGGIAFQRHLTPTIERAGIAPTGLVSALMFNPAFAKGGAFAREAGSRSGAVDKRDRLAWVIGLDHTQWIRWLNPSNSFSISGQVFWEHINGYNKRYVQGTPVSLLNDKHAIAVVNRNQAPVTDPQFFGRPGGRGLRAGACVNNPPKPANTPPCDFQRLLGGGAESAQFTLAISTPYMAGNLVPNLAFVYDFAGSWLIQPGINWTFWDPFRMQIRYNFIDGKYTGVGFLKTRDSIWLELQYLLY